MIDPSQADQLLDLVSSGLKSADSAVSVAGRLKGLFQSPKPPADSDVKAMVAELMVEVADTKLANAELKIRLSELLETLSAQENRKSKLAGYVIQRTTHGDFVYVPKDTPKEDQSFHMVCPNCYEDGLLSILQTEMYGRKCPRCAASFSTGEGDGYPL